MTLRPGFPCLYLHLAWIILFRQSRILLYSFSLPFRYFLVRDASGLLCPFRLQCSYMVFSTFLTFVYLLCCTCLLSSIFKRAVTR